MFSSTEVTRSILNRSSRMIQSYHIHGDRDLRIHFEPRFRDDAILPLSRGPRPPDTFWTEVQGWCNPTTFMRVKTSRYILNRSSGMMQSYHIHGGWDLRIHFEPKFRDDAIPPHSWRPKSPNLFWTDAPGWYNPSSFSRTKVTGSLLDRCPGMTQSLFILEDWGHQIHYGQMSQDDTIPLHFRGLKSPDHF